MKTLDLFIGITYAIIILFVAIYYSNYKFKKNQSLKRAFILSLSFKLLSAILFGSLYQFYYAYGDSINYHQAAMEFLHYIRIHPNSFFDFVFLNQDVLNNKYPDFLDHSLFVPDYFLDSNILVQRIVLLFGPFALFLFFPLCILFGLLSYVGCWRMYRTLSAIYPNYEQYFKISFLFLPSVIFWTSGIGKDAICIGFINLFASILLDAIVLKKNSILQICLAFFVLYIVYSIKSYIVLSFIPFFLYYLLSMKVKLINNRSNRLLIKLLFVIISIGIFGFIVIRTSFVQNLSNDLIGGALHLTRGQQATEFGNDSKYNLGITIQDIESKNVTPFILPAIEVALFRPYLWEVNKPIMIFSFLESLFFLLFTIYVFIKGFFIRTIMIILNNDFILFTFFFSILFSFFVGLVSLNFGTLIRYKTPFLSYFLIGLFILNDKLSKSSPPKK